MSSIENLSLFFASLGLTAWECLTGQRAREVSSISSLLEILAKPVASLKNYRKDVPEEINKIISSLVSVNPEERYQKARDMLQNLEDFRYRGLAPKGPIKGSAFIAIPFIEDFDITFEAIEKACEASKLRASRMDKIIFTDGIWKQTVQEIDAACVIIADLTGIGENRSANPNVATEAAHGRAIGKPIILLTQDQPEKLPFDWRHMPVMKYTKSKRGMHKLKESLSRRLKYILKS